MHNSRYLAASVAGTLTFVPINGLTSYAALKTFIAIFSSLLVLRAIYWLWIYPYYVSPLRHLPGPKDHHFLIGQSVNQFLAGNPNEPYLSWMKKWPDAEMIRFFSFGNSESILVTGLNVMRDMQSSKVYSFVKPANYTRMVRDITGKGLLFAEGEEHKIERRLMAGMLISALPLGG